ncbi:hypothetical protein [Pararhizobium arenae]|uniref:hypothetical protein n=1 Tax=Pararhizobium arenae TaxID=1856850 RepID=UPI001FDA8FDF|nr:hypothetical protein [Pararhizobium arenae]
MPKPGSRRLRRLFFDLETRLSEGEYDLPAGFTDGDFFCRPSDTRSPALKSNTSSFRSSPKDGSILCLDLPFDAMPGGVAPSQDGGTSSLARTMIDRMDSNCGDLRCG